MLCSYHLYLIFLTRFDDEMLNLGDNFIPNGKMIQIIGFWLVDFSLWIKKADKQTELCLYYDFAMPFYGVKLQMDL